MRKPPITVAAVIVSSVSDRNKFQTQIERQIQYQTYPIWVMRVANGKDMIPQGIDSARMTNADLILVMDSTAYYSADYVETQVKKWLAENRPADFDPHPAHICHTGKSAIYETGAPYPIALIFQDSEPQGKASNWALPEVLRTELQFFKNAYGI